MTIDLVTLCHLSELVFHWLPEHDCWEPIAWGDWLDFKSSLKPSASMPLPGIAGGIHHFVVCIYDQRDGTPIKLLPHKYLIDPDGRIGDDNFVGFTLADRRDYERLMLAREQSPEDKERLRELRCKKIWPAHLPPKKSLPALRRTLGKAPKPDSMAQHFLEDPMAVGMY
jgi:hypothetical protein